MLTNPGRDSTYDNCTTTLDSQPISPLPSGDDKPSVRFLELASPASLSSQKPDDAKEFIDLGLSGIQAGENCHWILEIEVLVSQDSSSSPCGEDKLVTGFDDLAASTLLIHQNPTDSTVGITDIRDSEDDDSILKVNVSMSPQSQQKATQTCLTPSEWQSVSDMPRINRTPYTNETQRITPLKERVRRSKQRSRVQYNDLAVEGYNNFNSAVDSASSNCSTVSTTFSANSSNLESTSHTDDKCDTISISSFGGPFDECCEVMTARSRERTQVCQHYFKTGTMVDGDSRHLEEEENVAGNYSDISSRDEQFIDNSSSELDPTSSTAERRLDNKMSGSSVRSLDDISSKLNMLQLYNNESDTDSDNDLGHFYVPSPLSKRCNSENGLVSSSLGYISSYPSVVGKSSKRDIMK